MDRTVETLRSHRALGERREPGVRYSCDEATALHLEANGFIRLVLLDEDWHVLPGRELRTDGLPDRPWRQVVACLSIWQDAPALRETMPTWAPFVDAIVVADGPYCMAGRGPSTDGLELVLLEGAGERPVHEVAMPGSAWEDQRQKRTALLQEAARLYPDALLFIVDADEFVTGAEQLRDTPEGDVAWVRVSSPLYRRPQGQPRLLRARPDLEYRGRHHWLYADGELLATHQYGGRGIEHRLSGVALFNHRGLGHSPERREVKRTVQAFQLADETPQVAGQDTKWSDRTVGRREALRIAQVACYDAGLVGYRLHTAINTTTPHASVFTRPSSRDVFHGPTQFDLDDPLVTARLREFLETADVVHAHLDFSVPEKLRARVRGAVVMHHHGTMYRTNADFWNAADQLHGTVLRLVSNLELLQYGDDLHFLPNPVPVARMRRLRRALVDARPEAGSRGRKKPRHAFRVAHSPSKRDFKGTDAFLAACERLAAKGIPIEPVLIEKESHGNALRIKATCDAAFDSFWLGIQCSGLEAAAMGLPVVAGDGVVAQAYREWIGEVPYTFATESAALEAALAQLATDPAFYDEEAERVSAYVARYHDDAAVALRYLDLLDDATHWRTRSRTDGRNDRMPVVPMPEVIDAPEPAPPVTLVPEMPFAPAPRRPVPA